MLVSVIIPVYNRESYISETLLTIKNQTFRPLELIIVDNCSNDSTLDICRDFAVKESCNGFSVKVVQEKRPGASACRNTGARAATGEWLSFFDSDDLMSADFIADAMKSVSVETQLVAGATNMEISGKFRRRVFRYSNKVEEQILTGELSTQSFIIRADFFGLTGGWNEKLLRWNDWELGVRILLMRPVVAWLRDKSYHVVRAHSDSITGNSFSASFDALMKACRAVEQDLQHSAAVSRAAAKALAYRVYMLAGIFSRERTPHSAVQAKEYADSLAFNGVCRWTGQMLMRYVARGGRGAWIAARALSAW